MTGPEAAFLPVYFDDFWTAELEVALFERTWPIKVQFETWDRAPAADMQWSALRRLLQAWGQLEAATEDAILSYYQEQARRYREMFSQERADQLLPDIERGRDLHGVVTPTSIFVPDQGQDFSFFRRDSSIARKFHEPAAESRVLGLILDCTWTDQGVGVLYVDEQVGGVREQTIVPF